LGHLNLAILGTGAWGTALAISLSSRHSVSLWARDAEQSRRFADTRNNDRYLTGFAIPPTVRIGSELAAILQNSDLALLAVPTSGLRATLRSVAALTPGLPIIWACKGFEAGTGKLPHQVVAEECPHNAAAGVLSGPSFAQEVAAGKPAALTLAAQDPDFARTVSRQLHGHRLRVYSSTDVIGVELGGALKNVIAIAAGISDGMELGYNARAALITRGLAEITRLGNRLGGKLETFIGLAGLGDLILTCTGDLSRNRRVGIGLARGMTLEATLDQLGHVAEGVSSAREVLELSEAMGVEMPITRAICSVLYGGIAPSDALEALLSRDPKAETP
jgi:glycerol-3-phosphate dehydrogenase (NAD(P)+)